MRNSFSVGTKKFRVPAGFAAWRSCVINSVPSPYPVKVDQAGPAAQVAALLAENPGNVLLADRRVWDLHLKGLKVDRSRVFLAPATENFKTQAGIFRVVDFLARRGFTKKEKLIVVGGGIIEDVGAFVGAVYKRGIDWVYFPTTLLSMCDSCIGGKTGINYKKAKNQLALFSAPRAVVINPAYLGTLPYRHVLSGLGEALKLHITGGEGAFRNYAANVDAALKVDLPALVRIIKGSLTIKRLVVEYDEFEQDVRRSMNYGHTAGHALEVMSGYRISHGEAVTVGMIVANELSRRMGLLSAAKAGLLEGGMMKLLAPGTRRELARVRTGQLAALLLKDKKTQGKKANFALIEDLGRMRMVPVAIDASLCGAISEILAEKFR